MSPSEIAEAFPEGANIGLTLEHPMIIIALLAPPGKRLRAERYIQRRPHLATITRYSTSEGVNLVLYCADLPDWANNNLLLSVPASGLRALLLHATSPPHPDILLPPSVGEGGFIYRWTMCGEVPAHNWRTLQDWFHFHALSLGNN